MIKGGWYIRDGGWSSAVYIFSLKQAKDMKGKHPQTLPPCSGVVRCVLQLSRVTLGRVDVNGYQGDSGRMRKQGEVLRVGFLSVVGMQQGLVNLVEMSRNTTKNTKNNRFLTAANTGTERPGPRSAKIELWRTDAGLERTKREKKGPLPAEFFSHLGGLVGIPESFCCSSQVMGTNSGAIELFLVTRVFSLAFVPGSKKRY